MGKPLQITTIALALCLATMIQATMARGAEDVECLRKSHSHLGFATLSDFESWYPRAIYFYRSRAQPIERGRLRFGVRSGYEINKGQRYWLAPEIIWEMLPDGRLFGFFKQRPGYKQIEAQRYICDATVEEILYGK